MARGPSALGDPLRRLIGRQGGCALADSELLERYVSQNDAASFEVLVWRHGAMVLGLCRRLLRDKHEAEDAFQATFLVLSKKAGSIGCGEAVGAWLHKVAYRVALRLRNAAAKRPTATTEAANEPAASEQADDAAWQELRPVLDSEIAGLPEKYRAPFVLCYLQGRTNEEAAEQLGCPKGTILSRLSRGREWLRVRLSRRGLAPAAVALALNLPSTVSAAVPATLAQSTAAVAVPFATGTAAGLVSPHVATLAEGAIHAMLVTKLKAVAASLLALAVMGTGVAFTAFGQERGQGERPVNPAPAVAAQDRNATADRVPEAGQPPRDLRLALQGKVVKVAKDGTSITVEVGGVRERGQARAEPERHTVQLTGKTGLLYHSVGLNGATPTEGYTAIVWLADNAKDTATFVTFHGTQTPRRGADITGVVSERSKDGTRFTVTLQNRGGFARGEEPEGPKEAHVVLEPATVVAFFNVAQGQAKLTGGQKVMAWYGDDGKTIAKVSLIGEAHPLRQESGPNLTGKVVGFEKNKSITIETPAAERGAAPTRTEIKITKTNVSFYDVPPDGAEIAEGMVASVWLNGDTKNPAEKVALRGTVPDPWTTVAGKVGSVSKDGTSFTIEHPPTERGAEPIKTEIKLTPKTHVSFDGVGPDEAKAAEGLYVQVRLLMGSKDTAATATFSKPGDGRR